MSAPRCVPSSEWSCTTWRIARNVFSTVAIICPKLRLAHFSFYVRHQSSLVNHRGAISKRELARPLRLGHQPKPAGFRRFRRIQSEPPTLPSQSLIQRARHLIRRDRPPGQRSREWKLDPLNQWRVFELSVICSFGLIKPSGYLRQQDVLTILWHNNDQSSTCNRQP